MKKKILSIFLAVCMVLTALPTVNLTAFAAAAPDMSIGLDFTDCDSDWTGTGAYDGVAWVYDSKTLTLTNATIHGADSSTANTIFGLKLPSGSTIVLNGPNTVKSGVASADNAGSYGIYADALTISGTGSLVAIGGPSTGSGSTSTFGLNITDSLTISSGTVTAIGGSAENSAGINGSITVNGGIVNAIGGSSPSSSYGITTFSVTVNGGIVTAKAGVAPASGAFPNATLSGTSCDILTGAITSNFCTVGSSSTYKVLTSALDFSATPADTGTLATNGYQWTQSTKTLAINNLVLDTAAIKAISLPEGAILDVQGINVVHGNDGTGQEDLCGVYSSDSLIIQNSGVLNVFAGGGTGSLISSYGILAIKNLSISSTSINAFGGTSGWHSYGIGQRGTSSNLAISSGNILCVGGTVIGSGNLFTGGLYSSNSSVTISDGDITAIGGEVDSTGSDIISTGCFVFFAPTISGGNVVAIGSAATSNAALGTCRAFFVNAGGSVEISGGKVTAIGYTNSVKYKYNLSNFEAVTLASTNIDGSSPVTYNSADIETYKYTKIAITRTNNLTAANFNAVARTVTYDGSSKDVLPTYAGGITAAQAGAITTYYTGTNGTSYSNSTTAPTNAGTYDVYVTAEGGTDYNALNTQTKVGTLTINKATPTVAVAIDPTSQSRPNSVTLSATGLSAGATGTLTFKQGSTQIGNTVAIGSGTQTVSFAALGSTDTYNFTVEYSGDNNYNPASSTATSFTFRKGIQAPLSMGNAMSKTYGDMPFTITATGGSGTGTISYSVVSGHATISGNTVTLTGAGTVVLRATKAADDDYNEKSIETTITVSKKPVTIMGATVQNKTYDGSKTATISGTPLISGKSVIDDVHIVTGSAAFADKTVGNGKTVTFTGFTLSGTDADKYVLTAQPANVTANITPKFITATVTIQSKSYDGRNAAVIASATLNDVVSGDTVNLLMPYPGATFASVGVANNIAVNLGDSLTLTGEDAGNYTLTQPSGITGNITNSYIPVKDTDYTVNRTGWGNTDFVVTAKSGFELSLSNTADGLWSDSLTRSDETATGSIPFYVRNKNTGAISLAASESYQTDKIAPTSDIKIGESSIKKALNAITFGLFFKETQSITITSADTRSGVGSVSYKLSSTVLDEKAVEEISDWTAYNGAFTVEPDSKRIVYAKVTDTAGNIIYLGSDGLVMDSTAPAISGIENVKSYCAAVTVTVTDANLDTVTVNGTAAVLTDGKLTLSPTRTAHTVVAADKAGNISTVTVTVYDGHAWDEGVVTDAPTASKKGVKTYTCTHCGETRTEEIAMLAPSVTEGQNTAWKPDEGGTLTFKSDAAFSDFIRVLVDGKEIDAKYYNLKEGSIIVTLKADYLAMLPAGTHTLGIQSSMGTATTEFTVTAKEEDKTPSKPGNTDSPQTGGNSNMQLWIALLFVSGGALIVFGIKSGKRKAVR